MNRTIKGLTAAAVLALTAGIAGVTQAHAARAASGDTATFTIQTVNRPDSGADGNIWAYDDLFRTVQVTDQGATAAAGTELFQVTVTDEGTFTARQGQLTPSGTDKTAVIANPVQGSVNGAVTYTVTAPVGSLKPSQAFNTEDDNFADTPLVTTAALALEPFTSGATVTATGAWSYTYKTAEETWVNSSAGNTGNITGILPPKPAAAPVLSHGYAQDVPGKPSRQVVHFTSDSATWVHFQIAGPGPINGHEGWVHAKAGDNEGVYSGLSGAHHTYAVFYTPVASQGSEIPTGNEGHVTFVTNPDA